MANETSSEPNNPLVRTPGVADEGGRDVTERNLDAPDAGARPVGATDALEETPAAPGGAALGAEGTTRTGETSAEGPGSGGTSPPSSPRAS
ncbi:MAG TPA: hypothetical protein VG095_06535 [Chthoniobacterales bacterium]|nr:hypothetical protein [Chthoniobacterales bacterium]